MTGPIRNPNNIVISVSMSRALLAEIDERAQALGLSRSQYLCHLAREDVAARGDLVLKEKENQNPPASAGSPSPISYLKPKRK